MFLQPADALSAFTQRQADAWAIWDPYTAQAAEQLPVRSIGQAHGRHQRLLVRHRLRPGAGRPEAQHRPARTCWCASRRPRAGPRTTPSEWAQSYAGAVGLDPKVAEVSQGAQPAAADRTRRRGGGVGAEDRRPVRRVRSDRSPRPEFADWVDRRYNDDPASTADPHQLGGSKCPHSSSGFCPPTATAARSSVRSHASSHHTVPDDYRAPTRRYLAEVARAADRLGLRGVLTPTGTWCEDAWLTASALLAETERLKFLVAFRPGLVPPTLAAQQTATLQRFSRRPGAAQHRQRRRRRRAAPVRRLARPRRALRPHRRVPAHRELGCGARSPCDFNGRALRRRRTRGCPRRRIRCRRSTSADRRPPHCRSRPSTSTST